MKNNLKEEKVFMKDNFKEEKAEIKIPLSKPEYEEAQIMAKTRGFETIEKLMEAKFDRIMRIYLDEIEREKEKKEWL